MKPFEYHWNDVGAPPLKNNAGDLLEVVKSCLITGYGSKPSAGWKLQYDGWTAKGEQKLAFSVGDETEQELIYWLDDELDYQGSAIGRMSLWSRLNSTGDSVVDKISQTEIQLWHRIPDIVVDRERNFAWHLYATKSFCWFFWEVKRTRITNYFYNNEGRFVGFGAVKDLFGEFLPQVIVGYSGDSYAYLEQKIISSGGKILLATQPFNRDSQCSGNSDIMPHQIQCFFPVLTAYKPLNAEMTPRLYIPGLLLSYSDFRTTELDQPFWQVKEKAGAKVGVGRFFNSNSLAFDLGEWDSPAWLNQLMSG